MHTSKIAAWLHLSTIRSAGCFMRRLAVLRLTVTLAVALSALMALAPSAGATAAAATGRVEGRVVALGTGRPVAGATVSLPGYGMSTRSGRDGGFRFREPIATDAPYRRIEAVVTARGFGRWTVIGVPLYPNDTLRLNAELRTSAFTHAVLSPQERAAQTATEAAPEAAAVAATYTCTGWVYNLVPPPTINVRITAEEVSRQVDFVFYLTHVLPSEWIPSWDADSLAAGAVSVRTYAHYRTMPGRAYSGGEGCADIRDNAYDQIFDPTFSHASTDQAVYATLGSMLYRGGGIFLAQYHAGAPGQACVPVTEGQFAGRMVQWASKTCADEGRPWADIAPTFYQGATWRYLGNLILNPGASTDAMYAWSGGSGTIFTRMQGVGYEGGWFLNQQSRTPGGNSTMFQTRPHLGTATTQYHAEVALQCPPENLVECTVSISVVAFPEVGKSKARSLVVTVPADGIWYPYTFDPEPHGFAHPRIRLSTVTRQMVNVDAAVLTAPYGGV